MQVKLIKCKVSSSIFTSPTKIFTSNIVKKINVIFILFTFKAAKLTTNTFHKNKLKLDDVRFFIFTSSFSIQALRKMCWCVWKASCEYLCRIYLTNLQTDCCHVQKIKWLVMSCMCFAESGGQGGIRSRAQADRIVKILHKGHPGC